MAKDFRACYPQGPFFAPFLFWIFSCWAGFGGSVQGIRPPGVHSLNTLPYFLILPFHSSGQWSDPVGARQLRRRAPTNAHIMHMNIRV